MKHPRLNKDTQGNDYKLKSFKFRVFNNQKPQTKNHKPIKI